MRDEVSVLFTEEQIARRVAELGAEITSAFAGRKLAVLGLMKGSLVFMADLIRRIPLDLTVHLVRVTTQREQAAGRVLTEIAFATPAQLDGKHVLLVEDIVDTGITLSYLLAHIHEHGPSSLRVCTLVDKPEDVSVAEVDGERTTVYELRVATTDLGKVIGKQGKTARAMRTILSAAGTKLGKRCVLEILE